MSVCKGREETLSLSLLVFSEPVFEIGPLANHWTSEHRALWEHCSFYTRALPPLESPQMTRSWNALGHYPEAASKPSYFLLAQCSQEPWNSQKVLL